ncbi:MAG: TonB-dependent receptor [Kofleriaceae bacterium]|nr:TonB-dependent receptor [Kofleriaceae bacterium]
MSYPHWPVVVVGVMIGASPSTAQPIRLPTAPPLEQRNGVVDIADLPPLPLASEGPSTAAALLAATDSDEDVVVGAAKREQTLGNVASAVTVITADRIRRFGYRTVAEAVAALAGVFISDDRMQQRMGIRGFQLLGDFNTRVLVLIDGASVNEGWGSLSGVGYDAPVALDEVARIEVIRGPVSSLYGTSAFFGIVNIVTRSAAETPRAWGRVGFGLIGGGTFGTGFARGTVDKQLRGSVSGTLRAGETLNVPDIGQNISHDGSSQIAATLVGAYHGTFGQLRAFRYRRESPFAPYDTDPARGYTSFNSLLMAEGGHTRALSDRLRVSGRGYFTAYRFNDEVPKLSESSNFITIGDAQSAGAEARLRYEIADQGKMGVTAGFESTFYRTKSHASYVPALGRAAINIPVNFNIQAAYAELDGTPTSWLGFTAGLRADRHSLLENRLSPRAALFLSQKDRYGAKLIYAEGFRNPSMFEGFFDDGEDYKANPNIRAETIRSAETVLWARPVSGLSVRLSGYRWTTERIVEQRDVAAGLDQFQNVGSYISTGVETEATYRNSRGWFGFVSGAVGRVRSRAGAKVPNAPAVQGSLGLSTPLLRQLAHVSSEIIVVGQRPTQDPAVTAQAHALWNASVLLPNLHGFDVSFTARNLLGVRQQVVAPQDYNRTAPVEAIINRVPGEGREVYLRVGFSFR